MENIYLLDEMVERLSSAGIIKHGLKQEAIKILSEYWKDKIALIWSTEDVINRAKENGIKVTKKLARDILNKCEHNHDCNYGVTWDTLDFYIDEIKGK